MSRKWPDPSLGYKGLRDLVVTREVHCTLSITMNLEEPVHLYVTEELGAKISHPLKQTVSSGLRPEQTGKEVLTCQNYRNSFHRKNWKNDTFLVHVMENGSI